ncbi:MAG: tRNA pseudouridine(38-40) synthase TruA [Pseudomonadota bacterium]
MRNIQLLVAYNGGFYSGWQIQPNIPTVQGEIEAALIHMTGKPCRVRGASRTDAGVHALGQIANFRTESDISCHAFLRGLNSLLPSDISILDVNEVSLSFDSRTQNFGKHYRYSVWNSPEIPPVHKQTTFHRYSPLNLKAMAEAARMMVGEYDFAAFRAADCECETSIRTIFRCTVSTNGALIAIDVDGKAFLKNMVRIMAGTLIDIGSGKLHPTIIEELLSKGDRTLAGVTAPAQGLCLVRVFLS